MAATPYTLPFRKLSNQQVAVVGGKNASLGELFNHLMPSGINVPDGFATTTAAYWLFLDTNHLREPLGALLASLDTKEFGNLPEVGAQARALMRGASLPVPVVADIKQAYNDLCAAHPAASEVAVRSSATAEDLPTASFAGQHDSFLNVRGEAELLRACLPALGPANMPYQ